MYQNGYVSVLRRLEMDEKLLSRSSVLLNNFLSSKSSKTSEIIGTTIGPAQKLIDLLGIPGVIADTDESSIQRIILDKGDTIKPHKQKNPETFSYVLPVIGKLSVRYGSYKQRQYPRVAKPGEVVKIVGSDKRSIETVDKKPAIGYKIDVNTSKFNSDAFTNMAQIFLESSNDNRKASAERLVLRVELGLELPLRARDVLEGWIQSEIIHRTSTLDS